MYSCTESGTCYGGFELRYWYMEWSYGTIFCYLLSFVVLKLISDRSCKQNKTSPNTCLLVHTYQQTVRKVGCLTEFHNLFFLKQWSIRWILMHAISQHTIHESVISFLGRKITINSCNDKSLKWFCNRYYISPWNFLVHL